MQSDDKVNAEVNSNKGIIDNHRRKRINRIKTVIVIIVILFLILPTIFCIILSLQVSRLQKQMDELAAMHGQYRLTDQSKGENYAYAAERTSSDLDSMFDFNQIYTHDTLWNSFVNQPAIDKNSPADSKTLPDKNRSKTKNMSTDVSNTGIYSGKKVYLTFDDGPSIYTDEILDILSKYHVKATFFVIGKTDKASKNLYKRIVDEGHILGMHSYSHKYEKIYNSVQDFDKDFTKLWKLLYDTTGYKPSIYRFPGGSGNQVNKNGMEDFIEYLNNASILYYDWNVVNGDATGEDYTKQQLVDNVLNSVAIKKSSIVLMHDSQTKEKTVDSLPDLLDALISGGAQILPLDKEVTPIQMIKADSVN